MKKRECGRYKLQLNRTLVMGILNVTYDSFYDGGRYSRVEDAIERTREMVSQGADIIDIGGESTRPGSEPVSLDEEIQRVVPLIKSLSKKIKIPISIDSYKPEVVKKALDAGAMMINDTYGLRSSGMAEIVAESKLPVVIMHMQGTPKNMQENPKYKNVVKEIKEFFVERTEYAMNRGVKKSQIILDPGIGFGKTLEHNLAILRNISEFKKLGYPLLVGPSRKSFIGKILDLPVEERLEGTIASAALIASQGADIVRVHDVKEIVRALKVADAIVKGVNR